MLLNGFTELPVGDFHLKQLIISAPFLLKPFLMRGDKNLCAHQEMCAALLGQGEALPARGREMYRYRDHWITPVPWCLEAVGWLALRGLQRASCCFTGWVCGLVNTNSRTWKELACNRLNNWVKFWNSTLLVWEAGQSMCCEAVWGADRCTWLEAHCSYPSSLHRHVLQGTILSWVIFFFFPRKHSSWIPRGSLELEFSVSIDCEL